MTDERIEEFLGWLSSKQPEALNIIKHNGFVFDDIGREPGNWKHLAFTLYSLICEIDSRTMALVAERAEA